MAQQGSLTTHQLLLVSKKAQQELLASTFNSLVITREQCILHVAQAQHVSYLQNFSRHKELYTLF